MSHGCIFCQIAAGQAPVSIVAETPDAVAFMDINQPTPGHVLVIPRAHIRNIYELDEQTAAAVFQLTVQVAKAVKVALQPDGLNLFQANERAGQQDVFHFHIHVVPRHWGDHDRIRLGWQTNLLPRAELDRLAALIRDTIYSASDQPAA